jgi:di/tricarboxylate transporter
VPTTIMSAFLNNTTQVAMTMPPLLEWARKHRVAPSKLLLPLSFAAILGGVCTLIGTSTNLVTHGMLKSVGLPGLGMWELSMVGIPIAVVGGAFLILAGPRLLPDRKEFMEQLGESRREFLVEMIVQGDCPLVGSSIQDAGLRNLPGLFLVGIEQDGNSIAPVSSDEIIAIGDRLTFTGVVSTIVDLQKIRGLVPATDDHTALAGSTIKGLHEAVVSTSSPLIGRSIRDANFRTTYDAAVIAVHRNGARLNQKIGDIVLEPGDTLLLMTAPGFLRVHRNNPDFFLVSLAADISPERHHRAVVAAAIALGLIAIMTVPDLLTVFGMSEKTVTWLDDRRVVFAFLAAGAMVATGCVSASSARRQIDWRVLVVIGASIGISRAMQNSGAAEYLARLVSQSSHSFGNLGALAAIYLITWIVTEFMSNTAAAALMFPIGVAAAAGLHIDSRPFVIAITIAASGGFISPIGYQTHLMVFGPGGYKQSDFLRVGLPMGLLWFATAMLVIPLAWPLE